MDDSMSMYTFNEIFDIYVCAVCMYNMSLIQGKIDMINGWCLPTHEIFNTMSERYIQTIKTISFLSSDKVKLPEEKIYLC